MRPGYNERPINSLPPVVIAVTLLVVGIELAFQLGRMGIVGGAAGVGLRLEALNAFAFSPRLFERMVEANSYPPRQLARLVTYSVVHLSFSHMLFVAVFLLALGKLVAETFASWAFLAILVVSAISGALVYTLLPQETALVGGYPAVYGLIGAYTFILWVGLGAAGEQRARAFTLIAFLLGIQLVFGALFGGSLDWIADLGGFAAGFLLSFVVAPGGWHRMLEKLRQR
ncbi:rhomboid family intramembrane serine protease [Palleronia caenipelagi]|uniref:Rhomboid family intramembrane serine protease n=2 Tax=Palleronia caenipelagi TaxID=2489174 RepID=A0A547PMZ4_9RHOB|nr:rhomboid family intramembrane serine protease [Palleronia caenipelagi]